MAGGEDALERVLNGTKRAVCYLELFKSENTVLMVRMNLASFREILEIKLLSLSFVAQADTLWITGNVCLRGQDLRVLFLFLYSVHYQYDGDPHHPQSEGFY